MKKRDRKVLAGYVRWMANELGLRDWSFKLVYDHEDDDAYATCDPCIGRRFATITFRSDFRDLEPDDQRECVVHELIHCHHIGATDIIRLDLLKPLGQETYDVLLAGFKRQIEYMTDGLASAIARKYPHIHWPT